MNLRLDSYIDQGKDWVRVTFNLLRLKEGCLGLGWVGLVKVPYVRLTYTNAARLGLADLYI